MANLIKENNDTLLNLNYSSEETFTGLLWIDKSKVYSKVVSYRVQSNTYEFTIPLNISNLKQVISVDVMGVATSGNVFYQIPSITSSSYGNSITNWVISNNSMRFFSTISFDANIYVILKYTKTN